MVHSFIYYFDFDIRKRLPVHNSFGAIDSTWIVIMDVADSCLLEPWDFVVSIHSAYAKKILKHVGLSHEQVDLQIKEYNRCFEHLVLSYYW